MNEALEYVPITVGVGAASMDEDLNAILDSAPSQPTSMHLVRPSERPIEGLWIGHREIDGAHIAALALPDKSFAIVDVTDRKRERTSFKRPQKVFLKPDGSLRASGHSRERGGIDF